jgi:UDP-N-acetylglucosamine:LPS N-acetylglucosamine transferase
VSVAPGTRRDQSARRVDVIYFDAGGGHRAAASALHAVLAPNYPSWEVELVNLRDLLEPVDFIRRLTGVRVENFYNGLLKGNLTVGIGPMLKIMHALIRRMEPRMVPMLAEYWTRRRPHLVVSMIPHFNRAIFAGLRQSDASRTGVTTPMATVMTDFADYPPHFWIERQAQYVICGTPLAARQALAAGLPSALILRASGMIVRQEFYRTDDRGRADELRKLGLAPDRPTGLVMFGGFGSRRMEVIAKRLAESALRTQLIFICGRNQPLRKRLLALRLPFPHHVAGFTNEVANFMRLSDYFIGKPGPGSISEALVTGLPVIVERNALTMVHERYNTDWILQNGVGAVIKSFAECDRAVAMMLDEEQMAVFRRRIAATENRAVFEIPQMLDQIMHMGAAPSADAVRLGA